MDKLTVVSKRIKINEVLNYEKQHQKMASVARQGIGHISCQNLHLLHKARNSTGDKRSIDALSQIEHICVVSGVGLLKIDSIFLLTKPLKLWLIPTS